MLNKLDIEQTQDANTITLKLKGALTTSTESALQQAMDQAIQGTETLVIDVGELEYISSIGMRLFLAAQKRLGHKDRLIIRNVQGATRETFKETGFIKFLHIEE
ncbi:MAG: STAS domain-containing protein [Butyrivibrio sp.]|nr:STAS domain-containing protein [Butyrivibrio sp.]